MHSLENGNMFAFAQCLRGLYSERIVRLEVASGSISERQSPSQTQKETSAESSVERSRRSQSSRLKWMVGPRRLQDIRPQTKGLLSLVHAAEKHAGRTR